MRRERLADEEWEQVRRGYRTLMSAGMDSGTLARWLRLLGRGLEEREADRRQPGLWDS